MVIVSLIGVAYIEAAGIRSTCIGDDSIGVISIEVAGGASIRSASVKGTD